MRELTPPGSSIRIAIDSTTYDIACQDYLVIGCQACGKAKGTVAFIVPGRNMSEHTMVDSWLQQFPRCRCSTK